MRQIKLTLIDELCCDEVADNKHRQDVGRYMHRIVAQAAAGKGFRKGKQNNGDGEQSDSHAHAQYAGGKGGSCAGESVHASECRRHIPSLRNTDQNDSNIE